MLPVYALTGNIVLGYNLLFLAAFVLSGLGMFLFVRALTGDWRAAFRRRRALRVHAVSLPSGAAPAGDVVAVDAVRALRIAPLVRADDRCNAARSPQAARGDRTGALLALTALALAAQNLSCGYYMLFFAPFVALYALWQMAVRHRLTDLRTWLALARPAAGSLALTLPFMTPYFALRRLGQRPRGIEEVASFSADTLAYLTAHEGLRVWSGLQTVPAARRQSVPGSCADCAGHRRTGRRGDRVRACTPHGGTHGRDTPARASCSSIAAVAAVHAVIFVGLFFGLEGKHALGPIEIRLFSVARPLVIALVGRRRAARAVAARASGSGVSRAQRQSSSPRSRRSSRSGSRSDRCRGCSAIRFATPSLYGWLYDYVPGFSGLRVPARFAMIVDAVPVDRARRAARHAMAAGRRWLFPLVTAAFLVEATVIPLPLNGTAVASGHLDPPTTVPTSPTPLTRAIDALPRDAILLELPFGDISWEIRYLYHSIFHWRRMVNGYSGDVPQRYVRTRDALYQLPEEGGDRAWQVIRQSGATHAIVHEAAFGPARTAAMRHWLETRGARLVAHADDGMDLRPAVTSGSGVSRTRSLRQTAQNSTPARASAAGARPQIAEFGMCASRVPRRQGGTPIDTLVRRMETGVAQVCTSVGLREGAATVRSRTRGRGTSRPSLADPRPSATSSSSCSSSRRRSTAP